MSEAIVVALITGALTLLGVLISNQRTQVETVQELLAVRGYYTDGINGIMDEATIEAVKEFQDHHELEVDGEVGGQTWSALLKNR